MDFEREIARLDAVIADNNAQDGPLATWRAADAVVEKADLIDRRDSVAAAIPLYEEAVRRLHGSVDAGPLALKAYSMNALAHAFHDIGDPGSAVRVSSD